MKHEFDLRRRKTKELSPEKLLNILRGIYPQRIADELFEELTGIKPAGGAEMGEEK